MRFTCEGTHTTVHSQSVLHVRDDPVQVLTIQRIQIYRNIKKELAFKMVIARIIECMRPSWLFQSNSRISACAPFRCTLVCTR